MNHNLLQTESDWPSVHHGSFMRTKSLMNAHENGVRSNKVAMTSNPESARQEQGRHFLKTRMGGVWDGLAEMSSTRTKALADT